MANEDKITSNAIETLRSDFNKISVQMADEVVYLKSRHQGSAAPARSLVLLGVKVVGGHSASRIATHTSVISRLELKGCGSWRNIRGTGITLEETKQLVCMTETRL